jgi:hypothetical protein
MRSSDFVRLHPSLYHMAEDGSWPGIRARGLLSTSELLTLYGYTGRRRDVIESEWRERSVTIKREGLPDAVVRDQLVMPPGELQQCLSHGLTPPDWYRLVNSRIFFWTTAKDLARFLSANSYRNAPHVVIQVDAAKLIERHLPRITLTPFNTGSTLHGREYLHARERGPQTFRCIEDYTPSWVKELAVEGGVPDIREVVTSVKRCISHSANWSDPQYEELETLFPD